MGMIPTSLTLQGKLAARQGAFNIANLAGVA
jgi:hypothetical protein